MLDRQLRTALGPAADRVARALVDARVPAGALTVLGLGLGVAAAIAAGVTAWGLALALWLASRVADGLDGPVARVAGRQGDLGGYLDIVADFTVYGAFVVGCAVGQPDARVALLVLLATYYVNGATLLALSSAAARRGLRIGPADERTHVFTGGVAEGAETILAHSLLVAFPTSMATIGWVFAGMVVVTIVQRVWLAWRVLADV